MEKIKNIVFDVGDVLLEYRWRDMLQDYGLSPQEAERIGNEMFEDEDGLWLELDIGKKSSEEIIRAYERKYPEDAKAIRFFISHGEYMSVPRPEIWERIPELKEQGYKIYLLSNYSRDLFEKHTRYADFMQSIDGKMVSYMIHKIKPDPAIYQALLEEYHLKAGECLFFDDRAANVKAAREQGMAAKQVLSKEQLNTDLLAILRGEFDLTGCIIR
ncbi:MAG: HAD family hydrolase [Lachnospiraceae bacterium]